MTHPMFSFKKNQLVFKTDLWPEDGTSFIQSEFDSGLLSAWERAKEDGVFWYDLSNVRYREVPGKFRLIAQLNSKRFAQRRKPEAVCDSVVALFDREKFNFIRVQDKEVLLYLKSEENSSMTGYHKLLINVSPIEYGHGLLCPNIDKELPQVLDRSAVELALSMCLLSTHRGLRIGFNSLGAMASVNHLHFHTFYCSRMLPIDYIKLQRHGHGLHTFTDFIVQGFALHLKEDDVNELARRVIVITDHFCRRNVAHNLVITRRSIHDYKADNGDVVPSPSEIDDSPISVYLIPKKLYPATPMYEFCVAFLELSGFLPMRDEEEFKNLTEDRAVEILNKYCVEPSEFNRLKDDILSLLDHDANTSIHVEKEI